MDEWIDVSLRNVYVYCFIYINIYSLYIVINVVYIFIYSKRFI